MTSIERTALFKEELNRPLAKFISDVAEARSDKPRAKWELSPNPDFGDYFTTAAIQLQTPQRSANELAAELACRMQSCAEIQRVESAESGFVNIFVSPAFAAISLLPYADWLNSTFRSLFLHKIDSMKFCRGCEDSKLRFAHGVWKTLADTPYSPVQLSEYPLTENELRLLTEPEEFAIILQLHEFPERVAERMISGYLYRLAVLIRDGVFSASSVAPYWLCDWEYPETMAARRFLLTLCEQVLRAGLLLAQNQFSFSENEA